MTSATTLYPEYRPVVAESRCSCGGFLLAFTGDFVSWNHCIACGRSELIAWVSYRPVTLGGSPLAAGGDQSVAGSLS